MGKLGKKARKFAKKNLQSVLKRKRKLKSTFKKRASKSNHSTRTKYFGFVCDMCMRFHFI